MTWAEQRKLSYVTITLVVIATILFLTIKQVTKVDPTCYDTKQNGGEVGVDCGGPCTFYCANELSDPKIRWVRSFQITPGVFQAVAYVEHSYPTAAAQKIRYSFKFYNDNGTLIAEKPGETFLGPMGRTAIVEPKIRIGNSITPTITRFSILPPLPWEKITPNFSQVVIKTDRTALELSKDITRLTATLENTSRYSFRNMEVTAILYDAEDNAITASEALLPSLLGEQSATMYFTWPFQLPTKVARIEIVPRFNPFTAVPL
jgi:hypothetical protein